MAGLKFFTNSKYCILGQCLDSVIPCFRTTTRLKTSEDLHMYISAKTIHSIVTVYLQLCEKQMEIRVNTDGYWWLSDG